MALPLRSNRALHRICHQMVQALRSRHYSHVCSSHQLSKQNQTFLRRNNFNYLRTKHLRNFSSTETSDPNAYLNSDPNDILSLKNLPLYQFARKTIRDKTLPEIHTRALHRLVSRFDAAVAEWSAASQLDRDARVQEEIRCTSILYEAQSETLDLLLNHVAELGTDGRLDPNIAYVDLAPHYKGIRGRESLKLKDEILEMYFLLADRKKWDFAVVAHHNEQTCVRIRGKSAYPMMKCETGLHESSSAKMWSNSRCVEIVVRPHFKSKFLPEVSAEEVSSLCVASPAVHVEHITSKLKAESSEHSTVVRNKAEAMLSLRQKMSAESWFAEKELSPSVCNRSLSTTTHENPPKPFNRYVEPPLFSRKGVVRVVDSENCVVIDKRISNESSHRNSLENQTIANGGDTSQTKTTSDSQFMPFPMPKDGSERVLLSPADLSFIQERLLIAYRRSLLENEVRDSYLKANSEEVVDLCRLHHVARCGSDSGDFILGGDKSPLLRAKCEELDRVKERLAAVEETLKTTREEMAAKCQECKQLAEQLQERKAFVEKLTKGKRDLSEVIKAESLSMMKKGESEKESFFKSLRRKESSLESLIDKRYSDRMDLSQDKFQVQSQLDRALSLIEKQQKDLKESGVRVNELTVQLGHLRNVMDNKDQQLREKDDVINSFRLNADRSQLLNQLEAAEAEAAKKVAEVNYTQSVLDEEKLKVERLTTEMNEMKGRVRASTERDKAKIDFLDMTVENLQTSLVAKEMENKLEVEKEKANVEAMRRQMRDYIKKHTQTTMDKEFAVLKLEKEVETLKKEVEMSGKREEALQVALNRERSGRNHANYMQEEEKRAWMDEWERSKEEERKQWQSAEQNLRERLRRLESENKEAKDTIENLIAFQQKKHRRISSDED